MTRLSGARFLLALSLILVLLAGCRSASPENVAESTGALSEQQAGQPTAAGEGELTDAESGPIVAPTTPSGAANTEVGASLPASFTAMLAELGNYRIDMTVAFQGQDATGAPLAFRISGTETVVSDPPRSRLDLSAAGDGETGQVGSMSLVRVDDVAYLYVPDVGCVSGAAADFDDDMTLPLDPRDLLEALTGAQVVANAVAVNGVETTEFQFEEASLPWSSGRPWSVSGSAFVEQGSDFLTRATMTLNGRGDLLGDGRDLDGAYDISIDVARVSGDEAVVIPDACRESSRYPVPPDAFEVTAIEELLTFKSRLSLEDVVNFYMSQMPPAGWQPSSEAEVFDDLAIMNFEQGGVTVMITVEYDAGSEVVSVLISP